MHSTLVPLLTEDRHRQTCPCGAVPEHPYGCARAPVRVVPQVPRQDDLASPHRRHRPPRCSQSAPGPISPRARPHAGSRSFHDPYQPDRELNPP